MSESNVKAGSVIVVDDDPRNLDIICHLLEDVSAEVKTAANAKEALDLLEHFDADLALFDIMMPGMNGYELCQIAKEKYPHLKVVLVSAKASVEERMAGYQVGADDYIPKPFDHDEFVAKVRVLTRLQLVEKQLRQFNTTLETRVLERTQEVQNMYQQLLLSSKFASLGELSASIAHEINNPLTILKGNVDYLREVIGKKPENTELHTVLDQQDTAIQRVVTIIQGLRRHARQDNAEVVSFNVHKSVEETLALFRPLLGTESVNLDIKLEADSPFTKGAPTRFTQILMNLLTNARDALKGVAHATIRIETRTVGDKLELVVSDNGCGMPEAVRNRIFDPFFTTKSADQGTGLGLSIVGSIITEMNGTVKVDSEAGKGTKFTMTFPCLRSEEVLFQKATPIEIAPPEVRLKGRALVIEDEAVIAQLVGRYLADLGMDVQVVLNGEEGLELLKQQKFDIVLTDLQLPKLKGNEVVAEAKRLGRLSSTRVIAVTGKIDPDLQPEEGKVPGFDGLLAKPFSKGDVYEIVRDLL